MLSNINGSLVPMETPTKASLDLSPTKEFLTFSNNDSPRESLDTVTKAQEAQVTPVLDRYPVEDDGDSAWGSPTTPYYLSKGAELVQQTCPPKQTRQLLFPLTGKIEDQPDESVRQRLLLARRKSLQWAPKVGSPLGRAVDLGK